MKKLASLLLSGALALGLLAGCGGTPGTADTPAANTQTGSLEGTTLKVGASPAPHAEILAVVKELLAEEGINLEIVEFTDYIQPNTAVENGSIDANYFQHITYLNNFNAENGTHLVSVADVHYEPFGIYAGKTASLEELQDGAQIGVPNDPTNGGRALLLLQEQGLITLKEDVGLEPTKLDIAENPHNYEIVEMEAAQLPRSLGSLDIAVINGNYAIQADLKVADALAIESAEGTAGTAMSMCWPSRRAGRATPPSRLWQRPCAATRSRRSLTRPMPAPCRRCSKVLFTQTAREAGRLIRLKSY